MKVEFQSGYNYAVINQTGILKVRYVINSSDYL